MIPPRWIDSYGAVKKIVTGPLGVPGRRVNPDFGFPTKLDNLRRARPGDTCWVAVEKIRCDYGAALTAEQHHFVRYFRDGKDSIAKFYDVHQPKNSMEFVFLGVGVWRDDVGHLPTTAEGGFWSNPWYSRRVLPGISQWLGPADDEALRMQVDRLDRVKASVEKHGMWMAHKSPEPTLSCLLIDDESGGPDDFRVLVGHGNHRLAFLGYAGWPEIPMSPLGLRNEVRLSDLENWPGVLDGSFTNEEARSFFLAFFRDPQDVLLPDW